MIKFLTKDSSNKSTETFSYGPDDFIFQRSGTAFQPITTNEDGYLDDSLIHPSGIPVAASSLQITKTANEDIQKGDVVYAVTDNLVGLATYNSNLNKALALGIATSDSHQGDLVTIVILGIITFPLYSVFEINKTLYLDEMGAISDTRPLTGYLVPIGKSLGNSSIIVQLGFPSQLGGA